MAVSDQLRKIDRLQQRYPAVAFVVAVLKKYSDDQGGHLAAVITYFAFFSLFPLLLVAVTVLGYVLQGNTGLQHDILNSIVKDIPVVGSQLKDNVKSLHGSGVALGIGIAAAVWAGLGITQAVQAAFNRIWHVPFKERPDFLRSRLRGLLLLLVFGGLMIVSSGLTGIVSAGASGTLAGIGAIVLSLMLNVALFAAAFRMLTSVDLTWRMVLPGAVVAAIAWQVLLTAGGLLFTHQLKHLNQTYGTFATVIGLLSLLYLGAQVLLIAAEVNVVAARRLWPRGLTEPLTAADRRALAGSAEVEERVGSEDVTVAFDP
jgi:YihY family inner membrane protein